MVKTIKKCFLTKLSVWLILIKVAVWVVNYQKRQYIYKYICFNYLSLCKLWTQYFFKNFTIKSAWQVVNGKEKYNVTNRSRWELITIYYVNFITSCSLYFLRKLFSIHYLKNCSMLSHKTPSEIVISKFKSQIWMLFHVWISQ